MVTTIVGIGAYYAKELRNLISPVGMRIVHIFLGIAATALGVTSFIYGLDKHTFTNNSPENTRLAVTVTVSVLTAWAMLGPIITLYNQAKNVLGR